MTAKQTVEEAVAGHKIVIFSKTYCPYCRKAKNLISTDFANLKDQIFIQELDESPDGGDIQAYLLEKTGQSTVPSIFINQKHIGGCDTIVSLKNQKKLAGLVAATA